MKILFSPIGMTDPIRFCRDGAALNIARNYRPDIIYLYMAKEIVEFHRADNRYIYCFERLGEDIGKQFEIKVIERPELEDVQLFDSFIAEFREILEDIHSAHPNDEIILNVSSGTPAMKSALQILSLKLGFACTPVQVTSPNQKSNPRIDDEAGLTPEEHWEFNESDENDNRCVVSKNANLLDEFRKQTVIDMVWAYNYTAACAIAEESPAFSQKCREMLDGACARLKLKHKKTSLIFGKYGVKAINNVPKECLDLYEYLLVLKVKLHNEEYADFLRALTPAIVNLFELYLSKKCGICADDYTTMKKGKRIWDGSKLAGTEILSYLNTQYAGFNTSGDINSDSLNKLIQKFSSDGNADNCAKALREDIEQGVRNRAAHTIVAVTADEIKKETGFSPEEIFGKLIEMFRYCGFDFDEKCYDKMNDAIIESVQAG